MDRNDGKATGDRLEWHDDRPFSTTFGDHFFSRADGRAECAYVFLGGNDLPERWHDGCRFTIAELGFGTGLNFLETARQWRRRAGAGGTLHFVSFEAFPMHPQDMRRALHPWRDVLPLTEPMIQAWPAAEPESAVNVPFGADLRLEVRIGDARRMVPDWPVNADAWFLDGFSPARNPEMWSSDLMDAVYQRTRPGGTFATYSAAGWVRRHLQDAGFTVKKVPGFAGKRDMTRGFRPP